MTKMFLKKVKKKKKKSKILPQSWNLIYEHGAPSSLVLWMYQILQLQGSLMQSIP